MKKRFIILIIITLFVTNGCASLSKGDRFKVFTYKEEEAVTQEVLETLVEAVKEKNGEEIEKVFSEYTKSEYDVHDEIEHFLEFIDGDIIEMREKTIGINSTTYYHDQGEVQLFYKGEINGIKTNKSKTYNILIEGTFHYRGREDIVGVNYLYIYDEDVEINENRERPGGEYKVGGIIK